MDYPATLPCPQIEGYQVSVTYGTTGVMFENGITRRRHGPKKEMHIFSIALVLSTAQLWTWQSWANVNGYDWHWMGLASDVFGFRGTIMQKHYIRYISDITINPVDAKYFRVSFQAEMDINFTTPGIFEPSNRWLIGKRPVAPATPDVVIAEIAPGVAPATDNISAGFPGLPAA